ncbi:MAG: TlpA family protein disulfide reductase [Bacteroidia bacterium]|nr:TlpA family protein disulfide reductase [Bacteroidia bacterium]
MTNSQIRISEEIQGSNLAKQEYNKLYFVDFWATWCAPCVHAKTYLTTIQKQIPNDFYVVSLTQETPETVKKFLVKRPSDLAIAIDYDKETFTKHNIRSLPEGILFNASGKILWKGHPADLKADEIKHFIRQSSDRISVSSFIELKAYERSKKVNAIYEPEADFELMVSKRNSGILDVKKATDFTTYEGNLKSILAFLLSAGDNQIELGENVENKYYQLNIMHDSRKHRNLVKHILKKLKLKMDDSIRTGEVMVFSLEQPKFWDTDQIDWGIDNPKYLIDDSQIQADNVSFNEIKYRLANLLEMPVLVDDYNNMALHDWQIHYKYYELMQSDLLENFGIGSKKLKGEYSIYSIQKKAP